ncbi:MULTISPECIES: NADH:flavin oxidoreductase/NADH oxidase [Bradyrhizobium]|jgi:2,4-dienoyl-CoA reductase-like NADH-dependent reductase (Old Yellow Enzyme family)|uniref:NADH:flavin oxidoreductase/NADH oxidase n=1 Tax=Bradyrhizobium TaxID=374 RepID=UPI000231C377|nr:NADH:flavin oxidoreductase/NADH oxidase [Bradyrhizobium japonicum]AJA59146.1 oxidoreductase [Bradyrhizobium japonicum]KMJ96333.1 oxidoreductase [Bradyrhizobium japonicum]MBR0765534.1 NADH:flavin oxidoreductase/NADH oxidase [Bradyrhizobium japonicum]MCS3536229.1 NADPH2 dehydrogenase [Bradyrhizobium japonicum]MCS3987670.1 NADPH2 dehydrogenase [Bradyrhizobium japonicum]
MSALFSPIKLRGLTLKNRVVVSPMCQYSADNGVATDWHFTHINNLALSGASMFCIEATHVEAIGRITPGCLGLYSDACEAALKPILSSVRKHSSTAIAMQLAHAGRKASSARPWDGGQLIPQSEGGWQTVAPSALPHKEGEAAPLALDAAGLKRIRDAFVDSAKRAARLGIDAIELHGAHGYLMHQFLSPISNRRTDEYGGSLENRMRFPLEIYDAVRAVFPHDKPVGMRVSSTDWVEGGWDLAQTIQFANALKARGVDWIDASSGGVSPLQKIPLGPGYQVQFADAIKRETGLPTMAVGLITEARHAEEIVASGKADMVALARGLLYDPRWGWHAAAEIGGEVEAPPQYWRSQPSTQKALFGKTTFGAR